MRRGGTKGTRSISEESTTERVTVDRKNNYNTSVGGEEWFDDLVRGIEGGWSGPVERLAGLTKGKREAFLDTNGGLHAVLVAIEKSDDDSVVTLSHLLLSYMQEGRTSERTRRARRVVHADGVSSASRALLPRLDRPLATVTDSLVDLLVVIANKDPKAQFKIRVGGLLQALCQQVKPWWEPYLVEIVEGRPPLTDRLLHLLARSIRSARNAQYASRVRDLPRATLTRACDSRVADIMARHLEILYLIAKNKKARIAMVSGGVAAKLVGLLERIAPQLKEPSPPIESALIVVGLLKLFANSRRGKEAVVGSGMVTACEKCLESLAVMGQKNGGEKAVMQLQDSICSLCIRCVPAEKFPLAGQQFPLSFPLPARKERGKGGKERRATTSYERAEDGGRSSDEDQEEADDELGEDLGEESGGSGSSDVDEDGISSLKKEGIRQQSDMPRLSSYSRFFIERQEGATVTPVKRKTSNHIQLPIPYSQAILEQAQKSRAVQKWTKIAYPDLAGPDRELPLQPLVFSTNSMRTVAAKATRKSSDGKGFKQRIVYDLDTVVQPSSDDGTQGRLGNDDRTKLGRVDPKYDHLLFESRFESGNLRTAIQTDRTHYELILQPDINQGRDHFQWFYFQISNGEANTEYTFEIVNCLKTASMFVHGMQPVAFSVGEAVAGRPGWVRVGHSICYYRNQYVIEADINGHRKDRFFSLRFTFALRHRGDVCYLAYHFPYTHSLLQATLECWLARTAHGVYMRNDVIGHSLGGNPITLVTITGVGSKSEVADRDTVIFTSRVHPGESNASWIMHGVLEYLSTSDDLHAREARSSLIFKCIPMLNPDGVAAGNHRCSLAGHDLNRVWDSPSRTLHPEIFHSKAIVQATSETRRPLLLVDLHGHSRKANCFLYGNNPDQSWLQSDILSSPALDFIDLAEIMETKAPAFSAKNCRWSIQRSKEGSARVALWRQLGISRIYTMECTYAGFESGSYKGYQIGISELKEIGRNLVDAALELSQMRENRKRRDSDL